jgi:hypothetical protein
VPSSNQMTADLEIYIAQKMGTVVCIGRDSATGLQTVVCIGRDGATGLQTKRRSHLVRSGSSTAGRGKKSLFAETPTPAMESTQPRILFKVREADHWPSSGVEIQNEWSHSPQYIS